MKIDDKSKRASEYFKKNKGFHRLLKSLRKKYESLGAFGGVVGLENLTAIEKEALSGFFGKDYYNKKNANISAKSFEKALGLSRYEGCDVKAIIEDYFGEPLRTKSDVVATKAMIRNIFFDEMLDSFDSTMSAKWLSHIVNTKEGIYKTLIKEYNKYEEEAQRENNDRNGKGQEGFKYKLEKIMTGINMLPVHESKILRMAHFAANVTGNPHFFDEGQGTLSYLLDAINYLYRRRIAFEFSSNAENRAALLLEGGLIKDDISNFVTCKGICGFKNNQEHLGMRGFLDEGEPIQLSLMNLSHMERMESPVSEAYIVENPAVFAYMAEKYTEKSLVCSGGQPRLAVIILLDMLFKSGCRLFYSGDFDPEGLLMAEKMKNRYGEQLTLWHYTLEDFEKAISNEDIDAARLKQMVKITDSNLLKIADRLRETGKAGYQELLDV